MGPHEYLNALVKAIPIMEVQNKLATSIVGQWHLTLAKRLKQDDELLEDLALWILINDPYPEKLNDMEVSLRGLREALRRV